MARWRVIEIKTAVREFEVEAKDREQGIRFVGYYNKSDGRLEKGKIKLLSEKVIDVDYETENLTLKEELKKGGEKE